MNVDEWWAAARKASAHWHKVAADQADLVLSDTQPAAEERQATPGAISGDKPGFAAREAPTPKFKPK